MSDGSESGRATEWIGAYRVIKMLGAGGMGEVLLAYDDRLDRHVAAKRVRREELKTSLDQERFLREARAAAKLSHPSIVQVHDIFKDDSGHTIVMEYVEGYTIAQMLERGPLPPDKVLHLAVQIADALAEAHQQGIVHRDIKSENVIVTPTGRAKVLDFGLAKQLQVEDQSLTATGQVLGTWRAMSPEQARGEKVNAQSDLFSLGVLLYEMAAGVSPFRGDNILQTINKLQNYDPKPLVVAAPGTDPDFSDLVMWLLQKDPNNRPQLSRQVVYNLQRIAGVASDISRSHFTVDSSDGLPAFTDDPRMQPTVWDSAVTQVKKPSSIRSKLPWRRGLAVVGLILIGTMFWIGRIQSKGLTYVAVAKPRVKGEGATAELLASMVQESIINTLIQHDGVSPIEPSSLGKSNGDAVVITRAVGADELFSSEIAYGENFSRITLKRVSGVDNSILWSKSLETPSRIEESLLAAEAVSNLVSQAFPDFRGNVLAQLDVRDEDYAEYLRLINDFEASNTTPGQEITRIDAILKGSPNFLSARIMAGFNALTQYANSGNPEDLNQAMLQRDMALRINEKDARVLNLDFKIRLERDDFPGAEAVLEQREKYLPFSARNDEMRSRLLQKQGNLNGAIQAMRAAVDKRPSWRFLYRLATLEVQSGDDENARGHFEQLLEAAPGNVYGMIGLANSEMLYGDLTKAVTLYEQAAEQLSHKGVLSNLGLSQFLMGNYQGAAESYARALDLAPHDASIILGLADSKMALELRDEADKLYGSALKLLEEKEQNASLTSIEQMIKAICLTYSGQMDKAVATTLTTLQENPDHPEIAFQASIVYALAGERQSALACIKTALERGIQPRFFATPALQSLRSDPRFVSLVEAQLN